MLTGNKQAIDALQQSDYDLVLMDLQMPILDGLSAIAAIRASETKSGKARLPIIAVSANAMAHHKAEALEAGADMHIAKPFTPASLLQGIEDILETYESATSEGASSPTGQAL